jgi:Putative Flp pilus-assembly TadE/G-like
MTERGEQGSVTVFVVGVLLALIVMGGLVFDGGALMAGHREADAEAEGAARAAAEQISIPALRSGQIQLNQTEATVAAEQYLNHYGHVGTVAVTGNTVAVTVTYQVDMQVLDLIGIRSKSVTGTGQATAVEGGAP